MGAELFIGADAEKVVVSSYPLRVRSGVVRRERTGSLVEFVCRPPSGRGRDERITSVSRLALGLIFAAAVLSAAGVGWWLAAAGCAGVVTVVWRRQARAAQVAAFAVPRDGGRAENGDKDKAAAGYGVARVLWTVPERAAFYDALESARRVRATWPALGGMIDPVTADRALTRALAELAEVLEQRQELRRLRADLAGVRDAGIPADSPARLAADVQRGRADEAWRVAGETANRILGSIDVAARAGEGFIRERQVAATARHAERTLARVTGAGTVAGSGPELADRTEAVIAAYRDLAA